MRRLGGMDGGMVEIGRRNTLMVLKTAPQGLYLKGEELGEILIPNRYVPEGIEPGDTLDVFVYRDSEDRLVATTEEPYAWVGEFGLFEVVSVTPGIGAFLDWGLAKDLLLPLREQARRVRAGEWVIAAVCLDPHTNRIVASTRLNRHLNREPASYAEGQSVRCLVAEETDLGFKAIVENAHWGLFYRSEMPQGMEKGDLVEAFVRRVREDGKLDLGLDPAGYARVGPLAMQIAAAIQQAGGRIELDDRSSPEAIRAAFSTSKKAFKQALGALLKGGRICFLNGGTEWVR
ncbi:MAG: hypothetical protein RLZZ244_1949 [Verrucomicrobiota bacterium]